MKQIYYFIIILLFTSFSINLSAAKHRKTVAVVLSGGGAKGVAHVKALKVIEEAGIPVDIIVGTSMGSIVGGLYASGYNAVQLDSIVAAQDWKKLLTDAVDRRKVNYSNRQETENFMLSGYFEKSPFEVVEGGILKANSIAMLMSELTADHQQSMDYNKLPIRFACVSTDLVTGKEIVMHKGILAESMRASMAIPGVFAPVKKDGLVLIDGGVVNNYPADVARKMGADIVIGIDVGDANDKTVNDIKTPVDALMKLMDNMTSNKLEENKALTDVYIKVDVTSYSAASFTKPAIDSLLVRGDRAARDKWDELVALRAKIGLRGEPKDINRKAKVMDYDDVVEPPSSIYNARNRASYLGIGARFDNEELASLLFGGMYEFNHENNLRAGLKVRLGKRSYADLTGSIKMFEKWKFGAQYMLKFNTLSISDFGESIADVDYTEHFARLSISRSWRMMRLTFGADCSYKKYTKVNTVGWLSFLSTNLSSENNISYNVCMEYDNMDEAQYPHSGIQWMARYNYYTDDGYRFQGEEGQHIVEGFFRLAYPLTATTTIIPCVASRTISKGDTHLCNLNVLGGVDHIGFYVPQQYSFAGVGNIESVDDYMAIFSITARQQLTTNNYLFATYNTVTEGMTLRTIFDSAYTGCCIGYGYRTPVGPIEANVNWSDITKKLGFFISLGYKF